MGLEVDVFCTLPEILKSPLGAGIMGRAVERGNVNVRVHDLHLLSPEPHGKIDDNAFGGGPGMVLRVDVVAHALEKVFDVPAEEVKESGTVILLTPQGKMFDQAMAESFTKRERLTFICGRYEGVDERIREHLVGEEVSIGDYVLSGGELAALVILESVTRLLPDVLGNVGSLEEESFREGLLEYPHYTRPALYREWQVPEVLLSGNHAAIASWRRRKSLGRTLKRRPDLLERADLTAEDREILREVEEGG